MTATAPFPSGGGVDIVKTSKFSVLQVGGGGGGASAVAVNSKRVEASSSSSSSSQLLPKQPQPQPQPQPKLENQQQQQQKQPLVMREWNAELEQDLQRLVSVGEECVTVEELRALLLAKGRRSSASDSSSTSSTGFNLYDGFEPSGRMHIAQGVFKAMNVNKCTYAGTNATFVFWVADWFALMNDKMGGDLEKIKTVGLYLIEVWKAAGMNLENVVFKWASHEITQHADTYWPLLMDVARRFNITRIKKCCQIMGRLEGSLTAAQILYPLMQCTDVFFLNADICQLGVDQRKVNMLAREYCDHAHDKNKKKHKPIILSHHMLYGLKAGQEKMSKSDPDSAIFMEDSKEDVHRKIMNAYCPSKEVVVVQTAATAAAEAADGEKVDAGKESLHLKVDTLKNPCLDYIEYIIFSPPGATFTAGLQTFTDFASVKAAFLQQQQGNTNTTLSEEQLKLGLIHALNLLLDPVRKHFTENEYARDLLEKIQQYKSTNKNDAATATKKTIRRLNLVELNQVPKDCHLVFAPIVPTTNPSLQTAVDLLEQLKQQPRSSCVLYLSDWSARVCNACGADPKIIAASYTVLLAALRALDPITMSQVHVVWQSEAILRDPSNYWISVINVGRHFMLDRVMGATLQDSDGVGLVIARLMQVADVAGVEPASLALLANHTSSSSNQQQQPQELSTLMSQLIPEFFAAQLPGLKAPSIVLVQAPCVRLQPERELQVLQTDNDEYFVLDDPKQHGKAKMKKAFCEPQNIAFCPPIAVASVFSSMLTVNGGGAGTTSATSRETSTTTTGSIGSTLCLKILRSADNGGDIEYTSRQDVEQDFAQGALHPGDLKSSVTNIMSEVLTKIAGELKRDAAASKAAKDLKAFEKKLQQQQNKKK